MVVDNLEARMAFLEAQGIDSEKINSILPTLNSIERMQESIEYVTEDLGLSNKVFERNPALFGYSMKKRIWPRSELLKDTGFDAGEELLKHIKLSNHDFETKYGISESEIFDKAESYEI